MSVEATETIVAGDGEISMGRVSLTNSGEEPSPQNSLTVTLDTTSYEFDVSEFRQCSPLETDRNKIKCKLPFLSEGAQAQGGNGQPRNSRTFELRVKPRSPIDPQTKSIEMKVEVEACKEADAHSEDISVAVTHEWSIGVLESEAQSGNTITWAHGDPLEAGEDKVVELLTKYLEYRVGSYQQLGPSPC